MKIVLTGATGFIGSNLERALIKDGHSVWAIQRQSSNTASLQAKIITYTGELESLTEPLKQIQPDAVMHLASLFIAEHKPADIIPLIQSNLQFPTHLLEAMDQAGCRNLINTGTLWQHFHNEEYNPVCLYAATKQAFQDVCRYYSEAKGFRIIHLQLSDSYGPNDPRRKLMRILQDASAGRTPLSMSPGEQPLDLVHIDDILEAYRVALKRLPEVKKDEVYALSTGAPLQLKELVTMIGDITGHPLKIEWGGRPYRAREVMHPWASGERLPGWTPKVALKDGLRQLFGESANARPTT